MLGGGGSEIDFLGGNRTCMYICMQMKVKKSLVADSNHKNANLRSSALLTTPSRHCESDQEMLG